MSAEIRDKAAGRPDPVGVVGAGAWGTALAHHLAQSGLPVLMWARSPKLADVINRRHCNEEYLAGWRINPGVRATHDLASLSQCTAFFLAVPSHSVREVVKRLCSTGLFSEPSPASGMIITSKGIERDTHALMSQVVESTGFSHPLGVLSGPTFASEIIRGLPTSATLASTNRSWVLQVRNIVSGPSFQIKTTSDVIGTQVCGVVKNVVAIGGGIIQGLGLGENAKAVFIAKAFSDVVRLVVAMGGQRETCFTPCGLADLILTASSSTSRNTRSGINLAQVFLGRAQSDTEEKPYSTVEGLHSARSLLWHIRQRNVVVPALSASISAILNPGQESFRGLGLRS